MSQLPSGARPANAIRELSGDQAGARSKRSLNVSRCSPLPSALTAYSSRFPSARLLAKTIFPVAPNAGGAETRNASSPTIHARFIRFSLSESAVARSLEGSAHGALMTHERERVLHRVAHRRDELRLEVVHTA